MSERGYMGDQAGRHKKHADMLEVVVCPPDGEPRSISVECAKCGEVVAELWNADLDGGREGRR